MSNAPKKATGLRDIRKVCSPRPLHGDELNVFWQETDPARDPEHNLRHQIKAVLEDADVQRILVCGHRGCGKSTELEKLVQELGAGWFTVRFSVHDDLPPVGVKAEDILLTVAARLVAKAREAKPPLKVKEKDLKPVHDYFSRITKTDTDEKQSSLNLAAGAEAKTGGLLGGLFDLFGGIRSELKFGSTRGTTVVSEIRKRPADLVNAVNMLTEAVRSGLPKDQRLLIVVEDLDKLSLADARDVFVLNAQLLASINANVIYTIPLFTFFSPEASVLNAQFDHSLCLPMIKVVEPDGKTRAPGFATIRQLILKRLDQDLIADDALDLLVEKTGGVLRHVFEVLNTVSLMTSLRQAPIRKEHVRYGLDRLRSDMATQIALPTDKIEGLDSVKKLHDWLFEAAKRQRAGTPCPRSGEPVVQVLLQSCALVEYNGRGWLGVHPLVQEYLGELGYKF